MASENTTPRSQKEAVSQFLKQIRSLLNMTKKQLASAAGVPLGVYEPWENGEVVPSYSQARQLRQAIQEPIMNKDHALYPDRDYIIQSAMRVFNPGEWMKFEEGLPGAVLSDDPFASVGLVPQRLSGAGGAQAGDLGSARTKPSFESVVAPKPTRPVPWKIQTAGENKAPQKTEATETNAPTQRDDKATKPEARDAAVAESQVPAKGAQQAPVPDEPVEEAVPSEPDKPKKPRKPRSDKGETRKKKTPDSPTLANGKALPFDGGAGGSGSTEDELRRALIEQEEARIAQQGLNEPTHAEPVQGEGEQVDNGVDQEANEQANADADAVDVSVGKATALEDSGQELEIVRQFVDWSEKRTSGRLADIVDEIQLMRNAARLGVPVKDLDALEDTLNAAIKILGGEKPVIDLPQLPLTQQNDGGAVPSNGVNASSVLRAPSVATGVVIGET